MKCVDSAVPEVLGNSALWRIAQTGVSRLDHFRLAVSALAFTRGPLV